MLQFFRNIRRRLFDSGSLRKYFVYAIGEILLVVIGILIALQINNWNEGRKDRHTEQKLLLAILGNLEEDQQTLKIANDRFHLTIISIARLLDSLPIPDDSVGYISTRATGFQKFLPITTAFDRGMSSGKFDLIRVDSIARSIQRLYAFEYKALEEPHSNLVEFDRQLKELSTRYDVLALSNYQRDGIYDKNYKIPWNIENLKKRNQSNELKAQMKRININVNFLIHSYEDILKKNEQVQQSIKQYLRSFKI